MFQWLLHLNSSSNVWKICKAARSKLAMKATKRGTMFVSASVAPG